MALPRHIRRDAELATKMLPAMRRIVGEHLILEASPEDDRKRATDLIVMTAKDIRIGCRVRRHEHIDRYGHQFTIRTSRPSGMPTELEKILDGWGDYLIYGFADADETALVRWLLGDLDVFRRYCARWKADFPDTMPGELCRNRDGSSEFRAFSPGLIRVPVTPLRTDEFIVAAEGYERYRPVETTARRTSEGVEREFKARPKMPTQLGLWG
jgi:hypothetical protein